MPKSIVIFGMLSSLSARFCCLGQLLFGLDYSPCRPYNIFSIFACLNLLVNYCEQDNARFDDDGCVGLWIGNSKTNVEHARRLLDNISSNRCDLMARN